MRRSVAALRSIPAAGRWCAFVAVCVTLAWGFITPPIHVPDENAHFAYAQYVAETGDLPRDFPGANASPEEMRTLAALRFFAVIGRPTSKPPWTPQEDAAVRAAEDEPGSRVGDGTAYAATNNPPLYYVLMTAPYWASPSHDMLDRIALMRMVSALLAGITTLFVFCFLREALPGSPWGWTVGTLAVAFQPMFGFISGGVNNDTLLYTASAGLFYALARAFRRGLTPGGGLLIGTMCAIGLLTKPQFAAFGPAVGLALLLLVWRAAPASRRSAWKAVAVAAAIPLTLAALYVIALQTIWIRPVNTSVGGLSETPNGKPYLIREQLSYLWQLYLPRLGFMTDQFPGVYAGFELWFKGLVGRFGWLDYGFPAWVYDVAVYVFWAGIAALAAAFVRFRRLFAERLAEVAVYATAAVGLLVVIGFVGYRARVDTGGQFEQARYVLPLLPLYAAWIAIGVKALGARAGAVVGTLVIVLAAAHTIFAQLLDIARFYG